MTTSTTPPAQYGYKGVTETGHHLSGSMTMTANDLAAWVRRCFKEGWPELTVWCGYEEVSCIRYDPLTNERVFNPGMSTREWEERGER